MGIRFVKCPKCNGYGVLDNGINCRECGGVGRGGLHGGPGNVIGSGELMYDETGKRITAGELAKSLKEKATPSMTGFLNR